MKGSVISKFSGDTTGAARCPGPTNPGAAGGTLTTRLIPLCCDMTSPSDINSRSLKTLAERAVAPFDCRIADYALSREAPCLSYCIYACIAAFALKMPLKLSRYCRKTTIHNTQATSAGAMVPGDIVRCNARML